jgi:transcriptional regulator
VFGVYTPKHFSLSDVDAHAMIDGVGAATLVAIGADGDLEGTFVPLLRDGDRLIGHVAKANPIHRITGPVLAAFVGPHGYVSPSWYPSKAEHGKVVPTWNYDTVHVHGHMRAVHNRDWVLDVVTRLTNKFEPTVSTGWQVTDAPADYIDGLLGAIVGIEITITKLVGKSKMSQNKSADDATGVVAGRQSLSAADELAQAMTVALSR